MARTRFDAALEKRQAIKNAEAAGQVADSMEVRKALMERVLSGEISPEYAQKELARIKRDAKKKGLITREQAFSRG